MAAGNGSNMHKVLVQCFTTHREMGLPEVFYRIIPALHLSQSNIDCIFLKTGYPKHRMVFLKKVNDEDYPDLDHVEVPGRTGTFVESSDVHDKYINRGLILGRFFVPEPSSFTVWSLGLGVRELKIQSLGFGVREQKKL